MCVPVIPLALREVDIQRLALVTYIILYTVNSVINQGHNVE